MTIHRALLIFSLLLICGCSAKVASITFPDRQEIPAHQYPYKVCSSDFDNDGRQDIAVVSKNGTIRIFLNSAKGFDNPVELQGDPYSSSLAAGDFNKDGKMDLAVLTESYIGAFYLGDGKGGFTLYRSASNLLVSGQGRYIEATDLNNDGFPDLIATGTGFISIFLNRGSLSFDSYTFFMGSEFAGKYIAAADLDSNNYRDIIFSDYNSGKVYIIWNNGDELFSPPEIIFEAKFSAISAAVPITLSTSPLPSLCIALETSDILIFLRNTGNNRFEEKGRISVVPMPTHLLAVDMNNDGIDDLVITHLSRSAEKGKITILYGPFPNTQPSAANLYTHGGFPTGAIAIDWDDDGYNDLFLPNYDAHTITFIRSPCK